MKVMEKVSYAEVWAKRPMSFNEETLDIGTSAKVYDPDSIALLGSSPAADQFIRIDLHQGKHVVHNIVVDGEWKTDVKAADAKKAVDEGVPLAQQNEADRIEALALEHEDLTGVRPGKRPAKRGRKAAE